MKNSIYSSAAGMLTALERLNIASNNIANINTPGFKNDIPFEKVIRFLAEKPYPGKEQPVIGGSALNMQNGNIKTTGRDLDLAFNGPGFFTVQGPNNETLYTRNGAFSLNSKRELVTADGFNVLDANNRKIQVFGEKFYFTPRGDVMIDGNYFTTLKIVDIPNRGDLEKVGDNFYRCKTSAAPAVLAAPELSVGALEQANINLMDEMVNLITIQRAFEFQNRTLDTVLSQLLRKTITDLPRPV